MFKEFYIYIINNLANIKNIVTTAALVMGAWVAWSGLNAWKKQLKGNEDYNLAKSLGVSIYKYQGYLFYLRSPGPMTDEYLQFSIHELKELNEEEKRYRELKYAYQKRWEKLMENKSMLQENIFESQVLWGTKLKNIVEKLFKMEVELLGGIKIYLASQNPANYHNQIKYNNELIFDDLTEDNKFRVGVNMIINEIENYLTPKHRLKKHKLFKRTWQKIHNIFKKINWPLKWSRVKLSRGSKQ